MCNIDCSGVNIGNTWLWEYIGIVDLVSYVLLTPRHHLILDQVKAAACTNIHFLCTKEIFLDWWTDKMNCCKNVFTKIILLVKIKLSLNIELNFIKKVTFQKIFQLKSNPTNKNLKLRVQMRCIYICSPRS